MEMLKKETLFETTSSRSTLGMYTKGFSFLADKGQSSFHLPMVPRVLPRTGAALVMKHSSLTADAGIRNTATQAMF